ncbi:hypothetical protein MKW98_002210 [Papaver atlanticum]|uniref:AB hydrolase-1 domain-containing protein n=1 Tax=Papaver atlanticum TaxID=357466 RepID=A0AAD4X2Q9_9MAGN|nr:hypothetical protein MKW98_002210 [Papaver atlanticum]
MVGINKKISAASARAHTRKKKHNSGLKLPMGMCKTISLVVLMVFVALAYQAIQPPAPKICGSSDGPPITAPRVKLSDGRHLAYKEHGVPKDEAKCKIVYIHGFDSFRLNPMLLSQELAEDLGVYMVSFDRAGYGESDPNPKRTDKSTALDVEELADQLGLGSKFYVIGFSMGGKATWGCLKYIPHRLAGAALLAPVVNYWWPGFPAKLAKEAYASQRVQDQWTLRVSHYAPFLTYWWNTQKWFPASSVVSRDIDIFSKQDLELIPRLLGGDRTQIRQQGESVSIFSDINVAFGGYTFDPMDLENPFSGNEGTVHLWHGDEDLLVPVSLQRYIAEKLPWIQYHELAGAGHLFPYADGMNDAIVKSLILGEKK